MILCVGLGMGAQKDAPEGRELAPLVEIAERPIDLLMKDVP
jgi:hypothetical protein